MVILQAKYKSQNGDLKKIDSKPRRLHKNSGLPLESQRKIDSPELRYLKIF